MRIIKFRGKDYTGKWHFGFPLIGNEDATITPVSPDGKVWMGINFYIKRDTIGQFTGLLDKNGKEIYEGDIFTISGKYAKLVKYIDEWSAFCVANIDTLTDPLTSKWPDECKYQQPSPKWWSDFKNEIEVIGNIYDNPELVH